MSQVSIDTEIATLETASCSGGSHPLRNLRGVRWRIDLGILPSYSSASVDDLRRVTADSRRRYTYLCIAFHLASMFNLVLIVLIWDQFLNWTCRVLLFFVGGRFWVYLSSLHFNFDKSSKRIITSIFLHLDVGSCTCSCGYLI